MTGPTTNLQVLDTSISHSAEAWLHIHNKQVVSMSQAVELVYCMHDTGCVVSEKAPWVSRSAGRLVKIVGQGAVAAHHRIVQC